MTQRSLDRLIRPQTIAVFGGREARRVIEQCDRMGFAGDIWPVHPTQESVLGRRCYRSVDELPAAPDAAFVGVNRLLTVDIVRAL
ncbi:CoA-binding protein, partial [Rhizobium sp.]|uniref:CoA-binding protein n=1 Tax=Rhizobium sp. TaxID=391 RepID=UPI002EE5490A